MVDTTFDQEAVLGKKATKSDADKAHEERQAKAAKPAKKDPFANLDTSDLDAAQRKEEAAAERIIGHEPELLSDVAPITQDMLDQSEVEFQKLRKSRPYLRRDYGPWYERWDQIITAPESKLCIRYDSESLAKSARGDFYKSRSAFKTLLGDRYPEKVEMMAKWRIVMRLGLDKTTHATGHYLIFEYQEHEPTISYELPELLES